MIRILIVDDEEPARVRLSQMLALFAELDIVGEAADGIEAKEKINSLHPDLVFLDIQMPGCSGLELASTLPPPRPMFIFCTAFDQFAIEAFEQQAIDYLLKPVNRVRLGRALQKAREQLDYRKNLVLEIQAARQIQQQLFPAASSPLHQLEYAGICLPARNLGGDYYDFISIGPHCSGIAVGDISGKGIYASLLMANLQGRLQSSVPRYPDDPAGLLSDLNDQMLASTQGNQYATLFFAIFDQSTSTLTYSNAGHLPPLLIHPRVPTLGGLPFSFPTNDDQTVFSGNFEVTRLSKGGMVLGLFPSQTYNFGRVRFVAGDILLLFSDGAVEASNEAGDFFGEERILQLAIRHAYHPPSMLRDEWLKEITGFCGQRPFGDDLTIVVVKVVPPVKTQTD
jgi:serine phosphatase RsbU (regulator of sigma subunit)